MTLNPQLHVLTYHYVRDFSRTPYPKIKGMELDEFHRQIAWLTSHYEMARLETALDFVQGTYQPDHDLCLLTFDDGLKEHYTNVAPILTDYKIQGLFGVITSCTEDHCVASVHMNHFLMAVLDFDVYRSAFLERVGDIDPTVLSSVVCDPASAQNSYPLDTQEVATFKFLFNFQLETNLRDKAIRALFQEYLGDEKGFAQDLYMSWAEIRQIQAADMLVAGHTHQHRPLSTLSDDELHTDLMLSRRLLDRNLEPQALWPFSYPYGKRNSYSQPAMNLLRKLGFMCAFTTEHGANLAGSPRFELQRIDCNGAIQTLQSRSVEKAEEIPASLSTPDARLMLRQPR